MAATALPLLLLMVTITPALEPSEQWLEKGQKAYQEKNYTEAVTCFTKALELNASDPEMHYQLGNALFAPGDKKQSTNHYYQAGLLFLKNGDKGSALRAYTMLRKTNSKKLEQTLLEEMYPAIKQNKC
ncbi:MAG: tetratricopeptide repeat protein [Thermodesulfobacteriota bacterium]|nr:tetratricopeptide repeat protein [Thermodesulfobacteriota bacterium]